MPHTQPKPVVKRRHFIKAEETRNKKQAVAKFKITSSVAYDNEAEIVPL